VKALVKKKQIRVKRSFFNQLLDLVETYREVTGGLFELYLSNISTKMNEIMKFLTIIATIFIPLGFIAGLYGMNFDPDVSPWNMPELRWPWGYPLALGLMAAVGLGLVLFFYQRGWFDKPPTPPIDGQDRARIDEEDRNDGGHRPS